MVVGMCTCLKSEWEWGCVSGKEREEGTVTCGHDVE